MGTLNAQLHRQRKAQAQPKPPCVKRGMCRTRKCPKRCDRYAPDLR